MTLLWMDGVYYPDNDLEFKYNYRFRTTVSSETRRVGPSSLELRGSLGVPAGVGILRKEIVASNEIVFGGAVKVETYNSIGPFINFWNDSGVLLQLRINTDTSIFARASTNGITYGTTAIGVLPPGVWAYLECKVKISDTVGVIVLKIDGVTVLNLSGLDTKVIGGNLSVSTVELTAPTENSWFWQDIYTLSTSGTNNTDFLGDSRVDIIRPDAPGTHTDFIPSAGANWENVDEVDIDGDTTYNKSSVIGDKDSYNMSSITVTGGQIFGVQQQSVVRKDDASIRYGKQLIKSGTTEDIGSELQFSDQFVAYHRILEEDPDTSAAWDETGVNAVESGLTVTA